MKQKRGVSEEEQKKIEYVSVHWKKKRKIEIKETSEEQEQKRKETRVKLKKEKILLITKERGMMSSKRIEK
jgi:hypothetical protein